MQQERKNDVKSQEDAHLQLRRPFEQVRHLQELSSRFVAATRETREPLIIQYTSTPKSNRCAAALLKLQPSGNGRLGAGLCLQASAAAISSENRSWRVLR
mmetsp:Transcript_10660/g.23099  ORF Transcript_10660/g.23099 Transcript_10660/m.23099 type:complete len:100 (-) Transcript_10660:3286-3585(-)